MECKREVAVFGDDAKIVIEVAKTSDIHPETFRGMEEILIKQSPWPTGISFPNSIYLHTEIAFEVLLGGTTLVGFNLRIVGL